jgi:two-component system NtrC family sensor kinase
MNLFLNAVQAIIDKGMIRIQTSADSRTVYIIVSDDGKGISPEHLTRIFDPGFTTRGMGIGSGLGLSICYSIIQKHKGTIDVESELGKGTTFTLKLPIDAVHS